MGWILGILGVVVLLAIIGSASDSKPKQRRSSNRSSGGRRTGSAPSQRRAPRRPSTRATTRTARESVGDFGITISYSTGRDPRECAALQWVGRGQTLRVGSIEIADPLTYTARSGDKGKHCADPSQIAPWLPAHRGSNPENLGYWSWYDRLDAVQRGEYLVWLASGRRALPREDGYLFVFYYGLERRALEDRQDLSLIMGEVIRLRSLHRPHVGQGRGNSFQHYSSAFLWYLVASQPERFTSDAIKFLADETFSWNEENLIAALSWFIATNRPLPTWMALVLAEQLPTSQRSVVRQRVKDEFEALFAKRFGERFPEGIFLKQSKRLATVSYRAASNALSGYSRQAPNAWAIQSQFKPLAALWNECIDELRGLSRVVGKSEEDCLTPEAWEAMPVELRRGVDHPLTKSICDVVTSATDQDGHVFVRAGALASAIGVENRDRYTASQSRRIAETVGYVGYGVEPDARLVGSGYKADDRVTLFLRLHDAEPEPRRYLAATCMLRFGVAVAAADGQVDEEELQIVTDEIERFFDLNDHEERRLESLRNLLVADGSEISAVGKRLREHVDDGTRDVLGRLLVAIAAADGIIQSGEKKALRRCYRALGLPPEKLDHTLSELQAAYDDDLVQTRSKTRGAEGEAIPSPPDEAAVVLDRDAIRRIMQETREVATVLADAMGVAEEHASDLAVAGENAAMPRSEVVSASAVQSALEGPEGLPKRFVEFYETLVTRAEWSRSDLEDTARGMDLMLNGALEAINEWAFDAMGGQLVYEDGDQFYIERELLPED